MDEYLGLINYFTAIATYKCLNGLSASQLSTKFQYVNDIHNRTTLLLLTIICTHKNQMLKYLNHHYIIEAV